MGIFRRFFSDSQWEEFVIFLDRIASANEQAVKIQIANKKTLAQQAKNIAEINDRNKLQFEKKLKRASKNTGSH